VNITVFAYISPSHADQAKKNVIPPRANIGCNTEEGRTVKTLAPSIEGGQPREQGSYCTSLSR